MERSGFAGTEKAQFVNGIVECLQSFDDDRFGLLLDILWHGALRRLCEPCFDSASALCRVNWVQSFAPQEWLPLQFALLVSVTAGTRKYMVVNAIGPASTLRDDMIDMRGTRGPCERRSAVGAFRPEVQPELAYFGRSWVRTDERLQATTDLVLGHRWSG